MHECANDPILQMISPVTSHIQCFIVKIEFLNLSQTLFRIKSFSFFSPHIKNIYNKQNFRENYRKTFATANKFKIKLI